MSNAKTCAIQRNLASSVCAEGLPLLLFRRFGGALIQPPAASAGKGRESTNARAHTRDEQMKTEIVLGSCFMFG